jgi:hypothetical protein
MDNVKIVIVIFINRNCSKTGEENIWKKKKGNNVALMMYHIYGNVMFYIDHLA